MRERMRVKRKAYVRNAPDSSWESFSTGVTISKQNRQSSGHPLNSFPVPEIRFRKRQ